jgi:hypothetical protein
MLVSLWPKTETRVRFRLHYNILGFFALVLLLAATATASAQQPADKKPDQKPDQKAEKKPAYVLTVKTKPILNVSLKAEKASMAEVAHDLSTRLKIPVFLGPQRQKEIISIEFSDLTLEPALQLMAPTVYVDYELDTGSTNPPKPLGIFFYDENQGEPPASAVVSGANQTMLIEGNTEDGVESEADDKNKQEEPLKVHYENYTLTVKAKKQPLPVVLVKIGEEIGIPVDIQNENLDPIDVDISKLPVEDAVRQLSPHIKLFYRADLTRAEKRALRLVLAEPAKTTQGP